MSNFQNLINKITQGYAVLELVDSEINGQIEIREDIFGKRTMVVGGLAQSGKEVEKIWKTVIDQVQTTNNKVQGCLILGLGAGTVAKLISQKYLDVKITGIEIDQEIINLGKKYFGLSEINNLEIVVADAIDQILNSQIYKFANSDLILIDLYLGNQYPKQAESTEFLQPLKKLLTKNGLVIFNRLYYHVSDKKQTDEFGKKLRNAFNQVDEKEINWNKFFFVR